MANENKQIPETLTWQAPSAPEHERSTGWYIGFIIISIALMAFAIYNRSILTIITFALIISVVFILSRQKPRLNTIRITKTGISNGNNIYPYKAIKYFWIAYNPPEVKNLNFETSAYINNQISLELGSVDPVSVKMVLSQYLVENLEKEESVSDVLARKLKI